MYVCSWNLMRYEATDAIGWCDWNTYRNWHIVTLDCLIAILLTCESGKLNFTCIIDTLVSPFCLQFFATDVCIKILDESVTLAKAVTHYWPSSCSHSESKSFWLIMGHVLLRLGPGGNMYLLCDCTHTQVVVPMWWPSPLTKHWRPSIHPGPARRRRRRSV